MSYLLGIDIGTSGIRTVLFDLSGQPVESSTCTYPLYQEKNGWAEQEPVDWWEAAKSTINAVITRSRIKASDIKGIGLSGQMHGLVMLDKSGNVLRRSIIWCDQRSGRECAEIASRVGSDRLIAITANPALTGFTASKILWVRKNEPSIFRKCAHILLPKDYVRYRLTGEFATDVSDASGMQLLDVPRRHWSPEVLSALEIDPSLMARVYESPEITGVVRSKAAEETGLAAGTPVVGGAGDNAAAAVGTGVVFDDSAFTTIGSSGVVYAHTSKIVIEPQGRVHTFCCAVPGAWHVMGVTQAAGLSLQWFRDNFCQSELQTSVGMGVDTYYLLDREAERIPVGCDRLIYLPYLMGERTPHLDPLCRGIFFGLSAVHSRQHLIRAVMEGVTYSLRECVDILMETGLQIKEMRACGGGGSSLLWRQMLADVFGCEIRASISRENAALGAAILAGVGAGLYASLEGACKDIIKLGRPLRPVRKNKRQYDKYYAVYKQLYPALKDSFRDLSLL